MQSLFEEFFKKVYGVSEGKTNSIMLIFLIRASIYMFFIGGIILVGYLIFTGKYLILFILIGLIFVVLLVLFSITVVKPFINVISPNPAELVIHSLDDLERTINLLDEGNSTSRLFYIDKNF